jgi:predicted dinucleotide-utilizing enzyme
MAGPGAVGVGLVGYGLAGRSFHALLISTVEGLRLCAIVTSDSLRAGRAAAEHPDAVVLATVDELLGRSDVEVVVDVPSVSENLTAARGAIRRHLDRLIEGYSSPGCSLIDSRGIREKASESGDPLKVT